MVQIILSYQLPKSTSFYPRTFPCVINSHVTSSLFYIIVYESTEAVCRVNLIDYIIRDVKGQWPFSVNHVTTQPII